MSAHSPQDSAGLPYALGLLLAFAAGVVAMQASGTWRDAEAVQALIADAHQARLEATAAVLLVSRISDECAAPAGLAGVPAPPHLSETTPVGGLAGIHHATVRKQP